MHAAAVLIELRLPGCRSLKEKRRRLRPVVDRLRRKLELSTAEVDRHEAWQRCTLGVAVVDGQAGRLEQRIEHLRGWLLSQDDVELMALTVTHMEMP